MARKRKLPTALKANQQCMVELKFLTDPVKRKKMLKHGLTTGEKKTLRTCREKRLARMKK